MQHEVVSREQWFKARIALLEHEKSLTRHRDQVSAERLAVCTENLIRVDDVMESPKLAE
jgi:predicted dithiol-disulfide oxidoreductase (DUF899 family)